MQAFSTQFRCRARRLAAAALCAGTLAAAAQQAGQPPGQAPGAPAEPPPEAATAGAAPASPWAEEVPFIVTPDGVTRAMLDLAGVGPGDRLIDLGSGDGRIVIAAARRGARALGVEIVPELVARSRDNARRAGVAARATFREQDLYATDLADATVITMYLLPEVNLRLRPRLQQLAPGTRIVSHDWDLGDWLPDRTWTVDAPDKPIGREKLSRLHLWVVPARLQGRWCTAAPEARVLELQQRHQQLAAVLRAGEQRWAMAGRVDADAATLLGVGGARLLLRWLPDAGGTLRVDAADRGTASAAGDGLAAWKDAKLRPCD